MLLLKNLNVPGLDANFLREIEAPSTNATVDTLVNQIASTLNLNPAKIELVFRGEILNRNSQIDQCLVNSNQKSLLFLAENRTLSLNPQKPTTYELASLANHVNNVFKSKTRRSILEKFLQNNEKFFEVIKPCADELKNDPVALSFIQSYDLIKLVGDTAKSESIVLNHPNIYRGLKLIIDYVREKSKQKPDEDMVKFISKASYSIDDMSEDDEASQQGASSGHRNIQMAPQQQPQQRQGGPALTQDYLASVLASIRSQPLAGGQTSQHVPATTSTAAPAPVQQQQPQHAPTPVMTRDYFQNVMQQMFTPPAESAPAAAPPTSVLSPQSSRISAPVPPQAASIPDADIAIKLEQMHELGLFDDELNLRALQITEGNVDAAVSLIIEGGGDF